MNFPFDRTRLQAILNSLKSLRIGILGDFALDGYWYADMTQSQLSRETPLFVRPVVFESYNPGGAANVAWNLASLGIKEVWAFSIFGDDWRGQILRRILEELGVRQEGIKTVPGWMTPFFGKVILTGWKTQQEDARLDFLNVEPIPPEVERQLTSEIASRLLNLDALIVADYQKAGIVTSSMTLALNSLAKGNPKTAFIADSRDKIARFESMVIKPNEVEAALHLFPGRDPTSVSQDEYIQGGLKLAKKNGKPVFITMGNQGCLYCHDQEAQQIPALPLEGDIDTVGAGDTFLASLTAGLAAKASPLESAYLASLSAAISCQKLNVTGTASPDEIIALYDTVIGRKQTPAR